MPERLTGHLPGHLDLAVLSLKDGVREVRHRIRTHRYDSSPSGRHRPFGLPRLLLADDAIDPVRHVLSAVDEALSLAERVALRAVRGHGPAGATPAALESYFPPTARADASAERAFRHDFYLCAKKSAAMAGLGTESLREHAIARAWRRVRSDRRDAFASFRRTTSRPDTDRVAGFCAALLLAFRQESTGGIVDESERAGRVVDLFAAPVLASGLLTLGRNAPAGTELLSSCFSAVRARRDRLVRCLCHREAEAALSRELALLLRHLP